MTQQLDDSAELLLSELDRPLPLVAGELAGVEPLFVAGRMPSARSLIRHILTGQAVSIEALCAAAMAANRTGTTPTRDLLAHSVAVLTALPQHGVDGLHAASEPGGDVLDARTLGLEAAGKLWVHLPLGREAMTAKTCQSRQIPMSGSLMANRRATELIILPAAS